MTREEVKFGLTVGDTVFTTAAYIADDNEMEEATVPTGTACRVVAIDDMRNHQGLAVTIMAPNGAVGVFDEADDAPIFPFVAVA